MKKALLILWCFALMCTAQAQSISPATKFTKFFRANQPDSIYNLFTMRMKKAIKADGTRQLISQIKSQLGEIDDIREVPNANGYSEFRLYDKRGVGKSMGAVNSSSVSLDDFIEDAKLFISKLTSDDRFSSVIVLGHSEGASIGMIASLQAKPDAYISVCGSEKNMVDVIGEQLKPMVTA